jgi:hypothetical protein
MAAANGIATFIGARETYHVSIYFDDTAGNRVLFDNSRKAAAGSPNKWNPPETVTLIDFLMGAASGQTTTQLLRNGTPTGDYLLNAVHLATVVTRPAMRKIFAAGAEVSAVQLA